MSELLVAMNCPLCEHGLTANDLSAKDGRYRCPKCHEESAEARRGWLPLAKRAVKPKAARGFALPFANDPMFSVDGKGETITRDRRCACGREYTQRLLSDRFLTMTEKHSYGAIQLVERAIPDMFVPVHCPRCERRDMHLLQPRAAEVATAPLFGYREAADR